MWIPSSFQALIKYVQGVCAGSNKANIKVVRISNHKTSIMVESIYLRDYLIFNDIANNCIIFLPIVADLINNTINGGLNSIIIVDIGFACNNRCLYETMVFWGIRMECFVY